jgi:hypothetical protein
MKLRARARYACVDAYFIVDPCLYHATTLSSPHSRFFLFFSFSECDARSNAVNPWQFRTRGRRVLAHPRTPTHSVTHSYALIHSPIHSHSPADARQAQMSATASTLEAEIDLLEKDIIDATDKERGLLALLSHLGSDSDSADPAAIAELERQLAATRAELDRLESALIHKMAKRSQRAKVRCLIVVGICEVFGQPLTRLDFSSTLFLPASTAVIYST